MESQVLQDDPASRPLTGVLCFVAAGLAVVGLFLPWFYESVTCSGVLIVQHGALRVFDSNFAPRLDTVGVALGSIVLILAGLRSFGTFRIFRLWHVMLVGSSLVFLGSVLSGYTYRLPPCYSVFTHGPGQFIEWTALLVMVAAFAAYARTRASGEPD
jgi:hypothetical protein